MWENCDRPEDWCNSVFVSLPKKGNLKQCTNYCTIALVSHASKIMQRIILEPVRKKTDVKIQKNKLGSTKEEELKIILQVFKH